MIEKAVQRSLDKASLSKLLMHEEREAVQRIIKVAVQNSKLAHKSNYEAVVSALRATLQDDVPDKYIENAVIEAIRENESKPRHRHLEMSRFYTIVFVCLLFLRHLFPQGDVAVAAGHGAGDGGGAPHIPLCQEDQGGPETPGDQISNNVLTV